MKKLTLFLAILSILLVMGACGNKNANLPSLPNPPVTEPTVNPCADGHTFPNEAVVCDGCGINYFDATLEFELSVTRDSYILSGLGTCTRTVIDIPATHKGKPVTELGTYSFNAAANPECNKITEINLPDSIVKINSNAFFKCSGLTKVTFNEGIVEMGSDVLRECTALETVTLPASMTYVPNGFLQYCSNIKSIEILGQITVVNSMAFYDCANLQSIVLPNTVTEISASAFFGCANLKDFTMSSSIAAIGRGAFTGCNSLNFNVLDGLAYLGNAESPYLAMMGVIDTERTEFSIHDDTVVLDYNAFDGSTVTSLNIGRSLTNIAHASLNGLAYLEYITVSEGNPVYHSSGNCLIETASKKIIRGSINSVIPSDGSVIEIGAYAFAYLTGLTSIEIPKPIQKLGGSAFAWCSNLEYAILPDSLTHIELSVFAYDEKFSTVYFNGDYNQWNRVYNLIPTSAGGGGMSFGDNYILLDATAYVYSENQPTTSGNYWHYVDGKPTAW